MLATILLILAADPIPVRVIVPAGPHYVGESIELKVTPPSLGEDIQIDPPRLVGAEIRTTGGRDGTYRLVPRRAGPLAIPPFRVRLGDRAGASRPMTLPVQEPPLTGRPSAFLGGIGGLRVEAELKPDSARVGEAIEYRIRLMGPGAIGSVRWPRFPITSDNPLGIRSDQIGEEAADDPPSRTFRFRLRATNPGEAAIPPISIGSFDPVSSHYQTYMSKSRKIRISERPDFDPSAVAVDPEPTPVGFDRRFVPWARVVIPGLAILATIGLGIRHLYRPTPPNRVLRSALVRIDRSANPESAARLILRAVVDDLARRCGRPTGALTPTEAASWYGRSTGNPEIGDAAARLVESCDRILFAEDRRPAQTLIEAAKRLLSRLEEAGKARKSRERHS